MKKRQLAVTDIAISPLGLGTVKLGRDQGVKYPESFTIPDDRAAADLIALARELGINLIDTAPAYGNSEQRLGGLLQGQRQDWVICTKVGEEFEDGRSFFDFSAAHTRASIQRSLKRLRTDYLDIVLIHSDGNDSHIIEQESVIAELQRCKRDGLVRAIGMSTKTVAGGMEAAELFDVVMATYNPGYDAERPVLDCCFENDTAVLVKKAFASGHLCTQGENPAQQALDFVLAHPAVSSAIVGTTTPEHLRANVEAAERALRG